MRDDYYYYNGKKMPLFLVPDACFVSLRKPFTGLVKEYFPQLKKLAESLAEELKLEVDPSYFPRFIVLRGDPDRLIKVQSHDAVHCTRNLYKDHNGLELALSDEVIVKFKDVASPQTKGTIINQIECQLLEEKTSFTLISVPFSSPDGPLRVANRLVEKKGEYVLYAVPNAVQRARLAQAPCQPEQAPRFGEQWHLKIVNAEAVWSQHTCGDPAIVVALIDSGVDLNHKELKEGLLSNEGWDFDADDPKPDYEDDPHGTACAGIIVAKGRQVTGIAPHCRVIPFRATVGTFDKYREVMAEVAKRNPHIISCSWHLSENDPVEEVTNAVATQGRQGKGIPIFCSAGQFFDEINQVWQGEDHLYFPATLSQKRITIAVGASTDEDKRWAGSNYGEGLDFLAPGWSDKGLNGGILTTDVRGRRGYSDNEYCSVGGTSLSTPLAAGVAALMLSRNPSLSAKRVRDIMRDTAKKINEQEAQYQQHWSPMYGYGRIDAEKAVSEAEKG